MSTIATTAPASPLAAADPGNPGDPGAPGDRRDLRLCWWTTVGFYSLFGVIFVPLARVMPPPGPDMSTGEIVAFYADHATTMKIGFGILMVAIGGAAIASGLVAYEMTRMSVHRVLAYAYIVSLSVGALPGCLLAAICCLTATFRGDLDPQVTALLYDITFLSFVGSLGCFTTNYLIFAVAVLLDDNEVFPKWMAYVTIWQIVTELLAAPVFIFRTGPLSWNGVISFWEGTALFGIYMMLLIRLVRRNIQARPDMPIVVDASPATAEVTA
jgi:hypothetical protein